MRKGTIINLSEDDIVHAVTVAAKRNIQSYSIATDRYGAKTLKNGWEMNIQGCLGEKAVSLFTGIPWDGALGDYSAADVGSALQVRSTTLFYKNAHLCLHPHDADVDRFVLALTGVTHVVLVGWQWGFLAKQQHYWGDIRDAGRPAYWVPQEDLQDMEALKELL